MTRWQLRMRDADPIAGEDLGPMPGADAVRRAVVAAASPAPARGEGALRSALAMAITIAAMVWVGAFAGSRLTSIEGGEVRSPARPVRTPGQVRQLQFSTPGGTRIIWIFNPDLHLNETMP